MAPNIDLFRNGGAAEIMATGGITTFFRSGYCSVLESDGGKMRGGCVIKVPLFESGRNFLNDLEPDEKITVFDSERNAIASFLTYSCQPNADYPWAIRYKIKEAVSEKSLTISLTVIALETDNGAGPAPVNPGFKLCFAGDSGRARMQLDWQDFAGQTGMFPLKNCFSAKALREISLDLKNGFDGNAQINFQNGSKEHFYVELIFRRPGSPLYFLKSGQKLTLSIAISIK